MQRRTRLLRYLNIERVMNRTCFEWPNGCETCRRISLLQAIFYLRGPESSAGVKKRIKNGPHVRYARGCASHLPSLLMGAGLGGRDLGDSAGGGPTPSSSELLDGLLPRANPLLFLLKYTPLFWSNIMCCCAARLYCLSCEATVVAAFVLNLDMVKSRGWSVSCRMTCEGG